MEKKRILLINAIHLHRKNLLGLQLGCKELGYELVMSDDRALHSENWDLVYIPRDYFHPSNFPNAKKIIYGPHNWVYPEGIWINSQMNDERCSYNNLSDWVVKLTEEFGTLCCKTACYPFGVDLHTFSKKEPRDTYEYDCFIYMKRRSRAQLEYVEQLCKQMNLRYKTFEYGYHSNGQGYYKEHDYKDALVNSKFGIWLAASESQGFALQEALATNTPLLVWNATSMFDEIDNSGKPEYSRFLGSKKLLASTVTCWSDKCGILVEKQEEVEPALKKMLDSFETFSPREIIEKERNPVICLQRMLE